MEKQEAVKLLKEAIDRLENQKTNADGGEWQAAGCYWRLSKVLREFVVQEMIKHQSPKQCWAIFQHHGAVYPVEGQKSIPLADGSFLEPMVIGEGGKLVRASEKPGYQGISFK